MDNKITNQIEYLFAIALRKCGNIHDAEDLSQEVILAALQYEKRGGVIENPKSWLASTLNHKFYDSLRRKYDLPMKRFVGRSRSCQNALYPFTRHPF